MTPLAQTYQDLLQTSPRTNAMIAAVDAAGLYMEYSSAGFQASDATAVQAILDSESGWLAQYRAERLAELEVLFMGKVLGGFAYTGTDGVRRVFQTDPQSQFNIDARSNAALGAIVNSEAWSPDSYFVAADNSHMPTPTAQSMRQFGQAAHTFVSALVLNNRALKDSLIAATSAAAIAAIDITAGWPASG